LVELRLKCRFQKESKNKCKNTIADDVDDRRALRMIDDSTIGTFTALLYADSEGVGIDRASLLRCFRALQGGEEIISTANELAR